MMEAQIPPAERDEDLNYQNVQNKEEAAIIEDNVIDNIPPSLTPEQVRHKSLKHLGF